jgi:3-oxoacyl-[acyl-carrier protein] reductase
VRFDGRRAVVTGGASGIGKALALALARDGAETWVLDVDEAALDALAGTERIEYMRADFASAPGDSLADELIGRAGCPDIVLNNVGITTPARALQVSRADWDRVLLVNLTAPFFFTQRIANRLREEGRRGSIVFVSSLHAERLRGMPHYSASKAALEMAAKELARDLAADGIRVNVLRPGWIDTIPGGAHPDASYPTRSDVPMGRPGDPVDLVRPTLSLLDDEVSAYVTGAVLKVDGGLGLFSWTERA